MQLPRIVPPRRGLTARLGPNSPEMIQGNKILSGPTVRQAWTHCRDPSTALRICSGSGRPGGSLRPRTLRYLFFHSLLRSLGVGPNDILLESPHPSDPKKEIDMIVVRSDQTTELVFEFKFHRAIPSGRNSPRPMGVVA